MAVDGSIVFNTKIDNSDYNKTINAFGKGLTGVSSKVVELNNKISQTEREIASLTAELKQMADTPIKSNAAEKLEKDVAKTKSQLKSLYEQADKIGNAKQNELTSMGFDTKHLDDMLARDSSWQKVQQQIDETEAKLQSYERELKQVHAAESQVTGKDTAEYQQKKQKLEKLSGQLNVYKAKLSEAETAENNTSNSTSKAAQTQNTLKNAVSNSYNSLKKFISALGRVGKTLLSAFAKGPINLIKKIGTNAKSSANQTNLLTKALERVKQLLVSLIVYKGLRNMFSSVGESLKDIAAFSPKFNKNMSALVSTFAKLKNTIATAFVPLINVVTPILTTFMNALTAVTDKVAQFFAVLAGDSTYTKAIDVQTDYAKSVSDSTETTKENTAATEENQKSLAGYDELNVMQNDSSPPSSADDSDGLYYATSGVTNAVSGFAEQLLKLFKRQDFGGIGQLVADKINHSLSKIKWSKIKKTLKKWASNIADLINGFVKKIDWNLVGITIAEGINTAVIFVGTLAKKINFKEVGNAVAKALNGIFEKIDVQTLGKTLASVINSLINLVSGFAYTFDWKNFGKTLKDSLISFIKNLEFDGAKSAFVSAINGLTIAAIEFIGEPDFKEWGKNVVKSIRDTLQGVNWADISSLFTTLVVGALDFIDGMVVEIDWKQLGLDIADSFKNFFGEDGGGYSIIKSLGQTFLDLLFGILTAADTIANSVDWGEFGRNLAASFSVDIGDESWVSQLSKTASDIVIALLDFINGVFEKQESADKFADGFSQMLENVEWEEIFIKALSAVFNIASWLVQLAGDLISSFCEGLATGFQTAENNEALNSAIEGLGKAICNLLITLLEALLNILVNAIPNFFIGLLKLIYQAFCGLLGFFLGDDFYQSQVNGLWGEDSFKVNIPINIPRLATGTVVPANYGEFLAVLGDNRREPEIVSPISSMKQAMSEVLAEFGGLGAGGDLNITLEVDGEVLARKTVKWNESYKNRHGKSAFV